MTDETFQKYDHLQRAKAAFALYNLIPYYTNFEDMEEKKDENISTDRSADE